MATKSPRLWLRLPNLAKSKPLYLKKAGVGMPMMGTKPPALPKPKKPKLSMGDLTPHVQNVLDQVPGKSLDVEEDDKEKVSKG